MSQEESRATSYTVISDDNEVQSLLEIKRSEFIAHLQRVDSESEARAYIEALRKRYHDARHVCSAFIIGPDRDIQRSSDDGEPAGTAGIPMLQALLSRRTVHSSDEESTNLSDVCIAVVRYFGGIKLGAGGLVRAYTDAVVQALDEASLTTRRRLRKGTLSLPHAETGKIENDIRGLNYHVISTEYLADHAELTIGVYDSPDVLQQAEETVAELSAGSAKVIWGETTWVDAMPS